jgi:hypothetical protein
MHIEDVRSRKLGLLLMILSIGSFVDLSPGNHSAQGEAYQHLARAALCEKSILEEPDFDLLHTLASISFVLSELP